MVRRGTPYQKACNITGSHFDLFEYSVVQPGKRAILIDDTISDDRIGYLEYAGNIFTSDLRYSFRIDGDIAYKGNHALAPIDSPIRYDPPIVFTKKLYCSVKNTGSKSQKAGIRLVGRYIDEGVNEFYRVKDDIEEARYLLTINELKRLTRYLEKIRLEGSMQRREMKWTRNMLRDHGARINIILDGVMNGRRFKRS